MNGLPFSEKVITDEQGDFCCKDVAQGFDFDDCFKNV